MTQRHAYRDAELGSPDWLEAQQAQAEAEYQSAYRAADSTVRSAQGLIDLVNHEDTSDLHDLTICVRLHDHQLAVTDAALIALLTLPADQLDTVREDCRRAVRDWLIERELGERA